MKRQFKNGLYEQFTRLGRALANPHRLEILDLLAQGERCVEDIATETGISIANASQHLGVLRTARMIEGRRDGLYIYYRLADPRVFRALSALQELGEARLAEVDQLVRAFLNDRSSLAAVTADELKTLLEEGCVILLDVRPQAEYRAGHIRGALSVPLESLVGNLEDLRGERQIIAYCRGPYCVLADEAVALLSAHGIEARRLEVGFPQWQLQGFPTEAAREMEDAKHHYGDLTGMAGRGPSRHSA
jgi:DNA-binding transcriptional ArsR family regulator